MEIREENTLFTARGDVADAFQRREFPQHLRQYCRLPSIKRTRLEREMWPPGCKADDFVTSECATLLMGWSWSLIIFKTSRGLQQRGQACQG